MAVDIREYDAEQQIAASPIHGLRTRYTEISGRLTCCPRAPRVGLATWLSLAGGIPTADRLGHQAIEPVARVSARRKWRLAVLVTALIAAAGVPTPAQARIAADPRPAVAGSDPGQFTWLAARVLTRPSAVRGTDGRFHIAYELVLTGATPLAVDVEQVEVRDAKTHRVLLSLAGPELLSRINPVGDTPAGGWCSIGGIGPGSETPPVCPATSATVSPWSPRLVEGW
jgi:hypothetical protein